jgi:hypothetical protein
MLDLYVEALDKIISRREATLCLEIILVSNVKSFAHPILSNGVYTGLQVTPI